MKNLPLFPILRKALPFFNSMLIVFSLSLLPSCYSVRIASQNSTPEPDPLNMVRGPYRGLKVNHIDTTIRLNLLQNGFLMNARCAEEGFYSVEYKVTLGGLLLSTITFGRCRKVKVKYVCAQP
jgi:hypothetical protein